MKKPTTDRSYVTSFQMDPDVADILLQVKIAGLARTPYINEAIRSYDAPLAPIPAPGFMELRIETTVIRVPTNPKGFKQLLTMLTACRDELIPENNS